MLIQTGPLDDQKEVKIEIPTNVDNVGVLVSGGTDSAILLYLVTLENLKHNKKIIPFTVPKHDGAALYSTSIVTYVNVQLGTELPIPTHIGNPNLSHEEIMVRANRKILADYKSIVLFLGSNLNPPEDVDLPGLYPTREWSDPNKKIIRPFLHLYKYHIIDLYFQFDQVELLTLTHTCTEQQIGRCNQCFQCHERIWAFSMLGKVDPGIK